MSRKHTLAWVFYLSFLLDVKKRDRRSRWGLLICDRCAKPRICRKGKGWGFRSNEKPPDIYYCRRCWIKDEEERERYAEALNQDFDRRLKSFKSIA